jgi:uncharacterized protein DUF5666
MKGLVTFAVLTTVMYAQSTAAPPAPAPASGETSASSRSVGDAEPPLPKGKSTVIGGTVTNLDRVRDAMTVRVFGSRQTMKILFDPRTRIFRDGAPATFRDLRNEDHVSVETRLDGTAVFAQSIHIFAGSTLGECNGQVLSYDSGKGELVIHDPLTPEPVKLRLTATTIVSGTEKGPSYSLADLKKGALISAQFSPDRSGVRIARQLVIQALPGTTFTFSGNVTYLDVHSGVLVLTDPRDKKTYEISFDRIPVDRQLHEGSEVTVAALFDGSRYHATDITVNSNK